MPRSATDTRLLDALGAALELPGHPVLVSSHHADTYRWQHAAVRVSFDRTGAAVHQHGSRAAAAGIRVPAHLELVEHADCDALAVEWQQHDPQHADPEALGAQLAQLHATRPAAGLPDLQQMLHRRWHNSADRPPALPALLRQTIDRSGALLQEATSGRRPAFLHGDLIPGNVLWTRDGPTLIDWELAAAGTPWWDLAHLVAHAERFEDGDLGVDRFLAGYGQDPRGDRTFDGLCRVRQAMNTISALFRAAADTTGTWQAEAARRLAFWDGDDTACRTVRTTERPRAYRALTGC